MLKAAAVALALVGCTSTVAPASTPDGSAEATDGASAAEAGPVADGSTSNDATAEASPTVDAAPVDGSSDASACKLYVGSQSCVGALPHLYLCPDACPAGMTDLASGGFVDGGPVVWCCGP